MEGSCDSIPASISLCAKTALMQVLHGKKQRKKMIPKWPALIRAILRKEEDGCTVAELADRLAAQKSSIAAALTSMPDTYVDRWTEAGRSRPYQAIWCVVVPPEDCPQPTRRKK